MQAKLETGGTVKATTTAPTGDYKERVDRLMSKTKDLKLQHNEMDDSMDEVAIVSPVSDDSLSKSHQTIETFSEEDEYIRINVSDEIKKASGSTSDADGNSENEVSMCDTVDSPKEKKSKEELTVEDNLVGDTAISTDDILIEQSLSHDIIEK
jgi:hypothetical protein